MQDTAKETEKDLVTELLVAAKDNRVLAHQSSKIKANFTLSAPRWPEAQTTALKG